MMYQTAMIKTVVPKQMNRTILEQGYQRKKGIRIPHSLDPRESDFGLSKLNFNITGVPTGSDKRYQYFDFSATPSINDTPLVKKSYYQVQGAKLVDQ